MRLDPGKLKSARDRRAITQAGLAAKCELSRKTIQRLELGEDVRPETVALVAAALGVTVEDLADAPPAARAAAAPERRLTLRRARSGVRIFETLAGTYAGRITCDVEVNGETVGPLTALITALQGLVSEHWGEGPKIACDLPLTERLRAIAGLNDGLRALEPHRVGCFMGHYYRYVVETGEGDARPAERAQPVVLTRIHVTHLGRDALQAPLEEEWASRPASAAGEAVPGAGLFAQEERFVFLEAEPPLAAAPDSQAGEVIDGEFAVVAR